MTMMRTVYHTLTLGTHQNRGEVETPCYLVNALYAGNKRDE